MEWLQNVFDLLEANKNDILEANKNDMPYFYDYRKVPESVALVQKEFLHERIQSRDVSVYFAGNHEHDWRCM